MAKTIDHLDLYVSIAPYKHETASEYTFDSLRVYVSYRKGRGFVVGYHPGWGGGSMWGCMIDGSWNPLTAGASVLAKAATKNSVKELQQMYDNLNAGTARKIIAFLFDQRKWEALKESMRHIALDSAWATEELLQSLTKPYPNTQQDSPMMRQFRDLKSKHPDVLLLFRCGDFYESYEEDAKECARVLGITLTKRSSDGTAMAGFPHHALDTYLPKLIRAGKRVAICDQLEDPKLTKQPVKSASKREQSGVDSDSAEREQTRPEGKRGITELIIPATNNSNNTNNSKSSTTMETKTMTAQDYVGKKVSVNGSNNFYVIKSADGDKLAAEFHMGDRVMPCPIPMSQIKAMVDAQKWTICDDAPATAEPEPIEDPKPVAEEPKAQTVTLKPTTEPKPSKRQPKTAKSEQPKTAKSEQPKPTKSEQPKPTKSVEKPEAKDLKPETLKPETGAKRHLRYETYTNKKGKTCARIVGFAEGDAMLERGNAERIHASSTYERDKGGRIYMLIFGPRYADAAKDVCKAMNQGKTLSDCQAIIDAATEERVQKREEWKAKRAAYLSKRESAGEPEMKPASNVGYSLEDVAAMLKNVMDGGAIPEDIKAAMVS